MILKTGYLPNPSMLSSRYDLTPKQSKLGKTTQPLRVELLTKRGVYIIITIAVY